MQDLKALSNASAMDAFLRQNVLEAQDGWLSSASVQAPVGIVRLARLEGYEEMVEQWFQATWTS